jgi:Fic family protein
MASFDPNKPYNALPSLPPKSTVLETSIVLKHLIEARAALAEVKQAIARIPNAVILVNSIGLREAQMSSEIENIVTTGDELFKAFSDHGRGADPSTKEVLRYREALQYGHQRLQEGRPLTTRLFEEIARIINETDEGVRKVPGTVIANTRTGKVIYTPPVGERILRDKLEQLERFIYANDDLDPLVRLALVHYQFEAIHPFGDGNGRTGRILILLYLVEAELLSFPVLFLSRYILQHRQEYYTRLRKVTERSEWERWILYMLEAVKDAARDSLKRIDEMCRLQEEVAERVREKLPKIYSLDLVQELFKHPYTKIRFLVESGIAKRQTASQYLEQLSQIGILHTLEAGREKYFVNTGLIKILQRP